MKSKALIYLQKTLLPFLAAALLLAPRAEAAKLNIIYVPLDDRPVCSSYAQQTMEAAGATLIMPPAKLLSSHDRDGSPDKLWAWLRSQARKADAAVISTDSLIYGGLAASRTHHIAKDELKQRLHRLEELPGELPIRLYLFSSIMRTPRASAGRVEPPYYARFGPLLFAYSELLDTEELRRLTPEEKRRKKELESVLPADDLSDWLNRRAQNFAVNSRLVSMSAAGKFYYLAIGKDDNAPLSATHMEARHLSRQSFTLPKESFQIIDGVDQLGLLLLARAWNEAHAAAPAVFPLYAPGPGAATLPQYSDSRLQDSVPGQIIAAGAAVAASPETADLVLAINTPDNGVVKNATADDNQFFPNNANRRFIREISSQLRAGRRVALADVSYSNGADNGFLHTLAREDNGSCLPALAAYDGWNTADNAVGFAIAQGLLSRCMTDTQRQRILRQRLFDDWFYQSNARQKLVRSLEADGKGEMQYDLDSHNSAALAEAFKDCAKLAARYQFTKGTAFALDFPWDRLFEVEITIKE